MEGLSSDHTTRRFRGAERDDHSRRGKMADRVATRYLRATDRKTFRTRQSRAVNDSVAIIFNHEQFRGEKVAWSFHAEASFKRRATLSVCSEPRREEKRPIAPKRLAPMPNFQ